MALSAFSLEKEIALKTQTNCLHFSISVRHHPKDYRINPDRGWSCAECRANKLRRNHKCVPCHRTRQKINQECVARACNYRLELYRINGAPIKRAPKRRRNPSEARRKTQPTFAKVACIMPRLSRSQAEPTIYIYIYTIHIYIYKCLL